MKSPGYSICAASTSVFFSYAIVTTSTAILFLPGKQQEKLSADVRQHLVKEGVSVESYESFWSKLSELKHGLVSPSLLCWRAILGRHEADPLWVHM
jgi:hypothetical protein